MSELFILGLLGWLYIMTGIIVWFKIRTPDNKVTILEQRMQKYDSLLASTISLPDRVTRLEEQVTRINLEKMKKGGVV